MAQTVNSDHQKLAEKFQAHQDPLVAKEPEKATEGVSREELMTCMLALKNGLCHDTRGNVVKSTGDGLECQFNRPEVDGSYHCYLVIPEVFTIETYEPKE